MIRILDLFCGAGGAAVGYSRAGFEVIGVDLDEQKNYPFEFIKMDAFEALEKYGPYVDAVHASPHAKAIRLCDTWVGMIMSIILY